MTIVSFQTSKKGPAPGPSSLTPLFVTDSPIKYANVIRGQNFFNGEYKLFQMIFSLAFLIAFSTVWLLGIKWRDISWMIIFLGIYSLDQSVLYIGTYPPRFSFLDVLWDTASAGYRIGFLCFLFSFLRIEKIKLNLSVIFLGFVFFFYCCETFLPVELFREYRLQSLLTRMTSAVGCAFLLYWAWPNLKGLQSSRKTRYKLFMGFIAIYGFINLFEFLFGRQLALPLSLISFIVVIGVSGIFLFADLAVFQQQFFVEKQQKIQAKLEGKILEESLMLGKSVQKLLFPKELEGGGKNFQYQFFHEAATSLSGDWFHTWKTDDGYSHFMVGDVVGKGPSAAVAVSTIFAVLEKTKHSGMEASIFEINQILHQLFGGYMMSTLMAISISPSKIVEIWNCGGSGWFKFNDSNSEYFRSRCGSLGSNDEISPNKTSIKLEKGDRLFCFTDGLLEGSRNYKKLIRSLENFKRSDSFETIYTEVENIGIADVLEDDKTLLALRVI